MWNERLQPAPLFLRLWGCFCVLVASAGLVLLFMVRTLLGDRLSCAQAMQARCFSWGHVSVLLGCQHVLSGRASTTTALKHLQLKSCGGGLELLCTSVRWKCQVTSTDPGFLPRGGQRGGKGKAGRPPPARPSSSSSAADPSRCNCLHCMHPISSVSYAAFERSPLLV